MNVPPVCGLTRGCTSSPPPALPPFPSTFRNPFKPRRARVFNDLGTGRGHASHRDKEEDGEGEADESP